MLPDKAYSPCIAKSQSINTISYLIGGTIFGGDASKAFFLINETSQTFSKMPHQLTRGRMAHGCHIYLTCESHEVLMIAGGATTNWKRTNTVELYDLTIGSGWEQAQSIPGSETLLWTFTASTPGSFYAIQRDGSQLLKYDPENDGWTKRNIQGNAQDFVPIISNMIALDIGTVGKFCTRV